MERDAPTPETARLAQLFISFAERAFKPSVLGTRFRSTLAELSPGIGGGSASDALARETATESAALEPSKLPSPPQTPSVLTTTTTFRRITNTIMTEKPTKLKLKLPGAGTPATPAFNLTNKTPGTAATPTPSSGGPKFKLSFGGASKPSTPAEALPPPPPVVVQKTKSGRASKPSAKVANKNGKRHADSDSDEDINEELRRPSNAAAAQQPQKKIKLSLGGLAGAHGSQSAKTPIVLKGKFKGKPPKRPLGEGYDSEASDREADPLIEEEFILRMVPGPDCDYLRDAIEQKKIGLARNQGGADVQMKFLHAEGRRAVVTIRGNHYAATLVDLPCIIEGMKSWDKRGWWKSADICQMLLVFAPIKKEEEAKTIELPKQVDRNTWQYPHGITPPMYNARKRRFRKRISRTAIEAVEDAVEKLLEADARADKIRHEIIEPEVKRHVGRDFGSPGAYGVEEEYSEDEDQDAEGDMDDQGYFNQDQQDQQALEDEMAAELEADLEAELNAEFEASTPASGAVAETPLATYASGTPDATNNNVHDSGADSGGESLFDDDDDDDDEDAEGDDMDEDERARLEQLAGAKEDIAEMERQLAQLQGQMEAQANPILKKRLRDNIEKVKAELQLKKSAIGEGDDE
jgi:transcription initiation factor TFIID subunit 7